MQFIIKFLMIVNNYSLKSREAVVVEVHGPVNIRH